MKISIIGTGYVGLVTGVCLAEKGHEVVAVDIDSAKVAAINDGVAPFYEPGLPELLRKHLGTRFQATVCLATAIKESELTFVAVGTPFNGKEIDLTYIRNAAAEIGAALKEKPDYHTVVIKSTVVPGTTDEVVRPILEKESGRRVGANLGLGMNPEFLSEGEAVRDFMHPDRFVLGASDQCALLKLDAVYWPFHGVPIIHTTNKTAEMIKYTSNALLATLISFSNEMANLCSDFGGIDAAEVTRAIQLNAYLTPFTPEGGRLRAPIAAFVKEGCGFGGSCLPKDVKALIARGERAGAGMRLLKEVLRINAEQPARLVALLRKALGRSPWGTKVVVLGLSFKPETDDLRESPAFPIIDLLLEEEAEVLVYDPVAMPAARKVLAGKKIRYCDSLEEALAEAEAVLLVTAWKQFERVPELLRIMDGTHPVVVDGRRFLDKTKIKHYYGIGL